MRRHLIPWVGSIVTPFVLIACAPSSNAPTAPAQPTGAASAFGLPIATVTAAPSFAACLSASSTRSCFSAATADRQSIASPATAPAAPLNLVASSSGSTVTLVWAAPSGGDPATQYIIEAGSAPGLANLANFSTGNAQTMYQASGVGAGTYFVRVRALNAAGVSATSNEAVLVVANGPCTPPGAPSGLAPTSSAGGVVSLIWSAGAGAATSYILEAGSAPGLSNLANSDLGSAAQTFTATGVASGTYYVRVRAKNACGTSGPSNEIVVSMGAPVPNYAGRWRGVYRITGCTSIDPPGFTPIDLCRSVVTENEFELVVSQSGPSLSGVFRNIRQAVTLPCACGGQYGTFDMAGAVTPDGGIVLAGRGTLIGTGVSESVTVASIPPAGAVGLTGNFEANGFVRAAFSGIIVSANRQ